MKYKIKMWLSGPYNGFIPTAKETLKNTSKILPVNSYSIEAKNSLEARAKMPELMEDNGWSNLEAIDIRTFTGISGFERVVWRLEPILS